MKTSYSSHRNTLLLIAAFAIGAIAMAGLAALLVNIQEKKSEALQYPLHVVEIPEIELDSAIWGKNFPREYDSFQKTKDDTISTPFGGSTPFSKLQRNPNLVRLLAGNAFSVDYNEERGHAYALKDQKDTKRQQASPQPGACANCHAAEAPQLIVQMGWENFNKATYADLSDKLHTGTSCADCHDPQTMNLRITRPAFVNAMQARGIDLSQATRQEMRTYVCGQCHVEYYFAGENKLLTFPWTKGLKIDDIEKYYEEIGFKDYTHKESGAPVLKMQHPEFEMWSTSVHARSGVACADCHMPYVREGSVKISDHWVRSPLTNINKACQTCHRWTEEELKSRVVSIQETNAKLLKRSEESIVAAIDAIVAAKMQARRMPI
jgi:nitrite reductase (cytochrome c-552)